MAPEKPAHMPSGDEIDEDPNPDQELAATTQLFNLKSYMCAIQNLKFDWMNSAKEDQN